MSKLQKGNAVLIVLLLVVLLGGAGYYLYSRGTLTTNIVPTGSTMAAESSNLFNYGSTSGQKPSASTAPIEAGVVTSNKMALTITSPANGSTIKYSVVTLTGKTSPNADVFVNDQQTTADSKGNFSFKLNLDEGQNALVVTANDADGNVVEQDLSVNIQTF